jgi:DNA polymerase III epsilon subunit-like protein
MDVSSSELKIAASHTLYPAGLDDVEIVVLDFETTGLSPIRHRVIEVGAVIIKGNKVVTSHYFYFPVFITAIYYFV